MVRPLDGVQENLGITADAKQLKSVGPAVETFPNMYNYSWYCVLTKLNLKWEHFLKDFTLVIIIF